MGGGGGGGGGVHGLVNNLLFGTVFTDFSLTQVAVIVLVLSTGCASDCNMIFYCAFA